MAPVDRPDRAAALGKDRTAARWLAGTGLAIALLTHLVFPLNYSGLIAADSTLGDTLLLVGRNLLMVVFTVVTTVAAIRAAMAIDARNPPSPPRDSPSGPCRAAPVGQPSV